MQIFEKTALGSLPHLANKTSQARLAAVGCLFVDQVTSGGLVEQPRDSTVSLGSFIYVGLGAQVTDFRSKYGAQSSVTKSTFFGCFHPLLARFVLRQLQVLSFNFLNKPISGTITNNSRQFYFVKK